MPPQPTAQATRQPGFLRSGWLELRRKLERRKLAKEAQELDLQRTTALGQLGQAARKNNIDLSSFPGFHEHLSRLEARTGELNATAKKLAEDKASFEARRQSETTRFDAQRQAVETQKRPVDASLQTAKSRLAEQNQLVQRLQSRLATLPAEMNKCDQQLAILSASSAQDKTSQVAAAQTRLEQLQLEQKHASEQLALAQQSHPSFAAEVQRLYDQSQAHAAEINRVEAERNSVITPITADLDRIQRELAAASQESAAVENEQQQRCVALGQAIYDSRMIIPAIATSLVKVVNIDRSRATAQAAMEASMQLTRAMPSGTMFKFATVVLLVPLLLVGLGAGGYLGWQWWTEQHPSPAAARIVVNPYLEHPLAKHAAYVLAGQLAQAKSEEEAQKLLLEAFRAIHMGVYTPAGKKILGGAEHSDRDFYLYDFLWKVLAHGYFTHTASDWDSVSNAFGQSFLHLKDPRLFQSVLSEAVQAQYEKATKAPDDPKSYLILLVDGLARQQLRPYTLSEVATRSPKELYVDRVQYFLLMVNFFTRPPKPVPPRSSLFPSFPDLIPTVYAQEGGSPCGPQGEQEGEGFSEGLSFMLERLEQISEGAGGVAGAAGKEALQEISEAIAMVAGNASTSMDLNSAVDAMTLLAGVSVTVKPQPYIVHLPHGGGTNTITFTAQVTADAEDVPPQPIPCGPLQGLTPVPSGRAPLKKVRVEWDWDHGFEPYYKLDDPTVSKMTGRYATFTDDSGTTEIGWVSRQVCPGQGKIADVDFMMQATAVSIVDPALEAVIGGSSPISQILKAGPSIYQFVAPEAKGFVKYSVQWHVKQPKQNSY